MVLLTLTVYKSTTFSLELDLRSLRNTLAFQRNHGSVAPMNEMPKIAFGTYRLRHSAVTRIRALFLRRILPMTLNFDL